MRTRLPAIVTLALLLAALAPGTAHAYLDPGTGSLVLQVLVAGLLGAVMAIRIYFQRLKSFFKRIFGREPRP